VIVLSENAGAYGAAQRRPVGQPFDVEAIAAALHAGPTMPRGERRKLNEHACESCARRHREMDQQPGPDI
jgi:trehalose-6-phosphate synthase